MNKTVRPKLKSSGNNEVKKPMDGGKTSGWIFNVLTKILFIYVGKLLDIDFIPDH